MSRFADDEQAAVDTRSKANPSRLNLIRGEIKGSTRETPALTACSDASEVEEGKPNLE